MSITLQELIVDLGPHGLLAITLGLVAPPQPANGLHGYARWHQQPGTQQAQDRSALFTLAVEGPGGSGVIWPDHVHALASGHVLALFGKASRQQVLRIVDVARGLLRLETTLAALRTQLGVVPAPYMPLDAVIASHGDSAFSLYLGVVPAQTLRVQLDPPALLPVNLPWRQPFSELLFGAGHVAEWERGSKLVRAAAWAGAAEVGPPSDWQASPANRRFEPTLARRSTRMALAMPRGDVQLLDLASPTTRHNLRPADDAVGAEPRALTLSPAGRFLLQLDETLRGGTVVDLEAQRRAPVALPDWDPQLQPDAGGLPLKLRAAWAITDEGGCVLEGGRLQFTPYAALPWQPLPKQAATGSRPAAPAAAVLAALRRPSLALLPARRGTSHASHAHGAPHLGAAASWPAHDGRPMALLCELSLAEVHAAIEDIPLPATGWLQCFTALDAEGEPLIDELFHPVALCVRHEPDAHAPLAALPAGHAPPRPLRLAPDRADLPPPGHPLLETTPSTHDYARWYDTRGEVKPGWRLGGYASALQPQVPETMPDAGEPHELLLQIETDSVFMWGTDSGLLYVVLPAGDAARGDFTRAVGVTQGF